MSAVTIYGLCAVSFMMGMYALERRGRVFIVGFALGCLLSSAYGFLSGAWPFGAVEIVWCGVALMRLRRPPTVPADATLAPADPAGPPAERPRTTGAGDPADPRRGPSPTDDPRSIEGS
jgi:hypothetical protein